MIIRYKRLSLLTYADGVLIGSYGLIVEIVKSAKAFQSDGLVAVRETREDPLRLTSS